MTQLAAHRARRFLLKPTSYSQLDLPSYFDFGPILEDVARILRRSPLASLSGGSRHVERPSHTIYSNKDGRYAWRPIQLVNPANYVDLVHALTDPDPWLCVQAAFNRFASCQAISCLSIPVDSDSRLKDRGAQVLQWLHDIEQATLDLALDFTYVLHADVSDCYASIYTHSISWALHGKDVAKKKRTDASLLGNVVDAKLQNLQHGQTNGIPQGSTLLDLIAELVLGHADCLLSDRLAGAGVDDFRILRYRDDYRVFVNDSRHGEIILKSLTETLLGLGLKLNASKTTSHQSVVLGAMKADKRAWMRYPKVESLETQLLLIHSHATEFPNAGSTLSSLQAFHSSIGTSKQVRTPTQLISIVIDIGCISPRSFHLCAAITSVLLKHVETLDEKLQTLKRIQKRVDQLPNSGFLDIWIQRISFALDPGIVFNETLCRVVKGENVQLWETSWITSAALKAAMTPARIVNRKKLSKLAPVVARPEIDFFWTY